MSGLQGEGVTVEGALVLLASWVATGFIIYRAVRKYRDGMGGLAAVLWCVWTGAWVGVVATAATALAGTAGSLLVNGLYVAAQVYASTRAGEADRMYTSQYGRLTRYRVKYLGGHPGFRASHAKGILLVTQAGLVLLDRYHANAKTLCVIPIDRISQAESHGATNRVVAWFSDMPLPMTFTSDRGNLAVQFLNDAGGLSVASFEVGTPRAAQIVKTQVDYAVYDWRRSQMGGATGPAAPATPGGTPFLGTR
jgi:hypothetical protein